ncbi:MAG: hypothetical protein A4E65_01257 [Syntrophorhabdus sp. PtaU1.Bin153]|nr:MAG: hypothetical protein A4E65_01257 [Syntrophorhabdus sp. PtaU1.Bin153]
MFYSPLSFLFMVILFILISFFFTIVQIDVIAAVFERIGIPSRYVINALMASFLGSLINIPVKKIPQKAMTTQKRMSFFGFRYIIPVTRRNYTILAVNVGGAVVPVCISAYLLLKTGLYFQSAIATGCMALAAYRMARAIPGVGIALPFFLPPALAAIVSVIIAYNSAPVVAYISGSLGTLIGADILNLKKIAYLGAPVASIGGAGTFDGVFLSGILAVLLSALLV